MNSNTEQRKHKRFRAQEGSFAVVQAGNLKLGHIINISSGGLAINYIDDGEQLAVSTEIDIFLSNNRFRLEGVPSKIVSDFGRISESPMSSLIMRRCGVEFGELSKEQQIQLNYFIKNHTICEA